MFSSLHGKSGSKKRKERIDRLQRENNIVKKMKPLSDLWNKPGVSVAAGDMSSQVSGNNLNDSFASTSSFKTFLATDNPDKAPVAKNNSHGAMELEESETCSFINKNCHHTITVESETASETESEISVHDSNFVSTDSNVSSSNRADCHNITITKERENVSFNLNDPFEWSSHVELTDEIRIELVKKGPVQVKALDMPHNQFPINKKRHFSDSYYIKNTPSGNHPRKWLIYSKLNDSVYCFPCKLFNNGTNTSPFLSKNGYSDWKSLSKALQDHENSTNHWKNYYNWKQLDGNLKKNSTIDSSFQKKVNDERHRWRLVLQRILDAILYLAEHNLGFRGSSDLIFSENNGNFLSLLQLMGKYDAVLMEHLWRAKKSTNVHYLSKDSQNEFINLLAKKVRNTILEKIKASRFFSVQLDCTPDVSHTEQLSLVIRYMEMESGSLGHPTILESFIEFVDVHDTTGEGLCKTLLDRLHHHGIDSEGMIGQCYDNGANMAGKYNGVQNRVKEIFPKALYVPCLCHNWNLAVMHASESSIESQTFFVTIQGVYTFFAASVKRWEILVKHLKKFTLKCHSETRWCSRFESVKAIYFQLPELVAALDELAENRQLQSFEIQSLKDTILKFSFIVSLVIWFELLSEINRVTVIMQSPNYKLSNALLLISNVKQFLDEYRQQGFQKALCKATEIAETLGTEPIFTQRRAFKPKRMFDEIAVHEEIDNLQRKFEIQFFNVLVDRVSLEIQVRFNALQHFEQTYGFLMNIHASVLDEDNLKLSCCNLQIYLNNIVDSDELFKEIKFMSSNLPSHIYKAEEVFNNMCATDLSSVLPNLYLAFKILLILPVSVASSERSFSRLKLIKSYLRSTMIQERLSSLAILSIEHKIANSINFDDVIDEFAFSKSRRVNF